MTTEFRARVLVRVESFDSKGVMVVISGWKWRRRFRVINIPIKLLTNKTVKPPYCYYAYAEVNLKAEYVRDLNLKWLND